MTQRMKGFESAVEWLRPFVDSKVWDFCVVWKLGDDPSRYQLSTYLFHSFFLGGVHLSSDKAFFFCRFIEWKDCCCGGSSNIKEEKDELQVQGPLCRDERFQHSIRSKACEALSHFPFVMSLYSGYIH